MKARLPPATIRALAKDLEYEGPLLADPDGQAVELLGLTKLPAVVLLDPQQRVHAVFQEVNETTRPQIDKSIGELLSGRR